MLQLTFYHKLPSSLIFCLLILHLSHLLLLLFQRLCLVLSTNLALYKFLFVFVLLFHTKTIITGYLKTVTYRLLLRH